MASQLIEAMTPEVESRRATRTSFARSCAGSSTSRWRASAGKKVQRAQGGGGRGARRSDDERRGLHGAAEAQPGKERTGRRGAQEPAQDFATAPTQRAAQGVLTLK